MWDANAAKLRGYAEVEAAIDPRVVAQGAIGDLRDQLAALYGDRMFADLAPDASAEDLHAVDRLAKELSAALAKVTPKPPEPEPVQAVILTDEDSIPF